MLADCTVGGLGWLIEQCFAHKLHRFGVTMIDRSVGASRQSAAAAAVHIWTGARPARAPSPAGSDIFG